MHVCFYRSPEYIYIPTFNPATVLQFQEYTVDMYFRTEWYDPRLTYNEIEQGLNLNAEMVEKVWVPDTYFVNEKDARFHNVISKNSLIRLLPEGRLLFSTRLVNKHILP